MNMNQGVRLQQMERIWSHFCRSEGLEEIRFNIVLLLAGFVYAVVFISGGCWYGLLILEREII